jgi:uncharacterized OsmC-like protein/pimeloyl-ACP methyl ester carboxylesterase
MQFDFQNQDGEKLSGRLEMPNQKPKAYALFAHCFTCSKNVRAAATISRKLTEAGIAVLRFDFTGLGNSEGDFSNTNFSSNVQDLVSACQALGETFEHPQLLVGHSLGGAAVLKASTLLPAVTAVATLASPSDAEHVSHMFEGQKVQINKEGLAQVELAGRHFTIKKQFLDDIESVKVLEDFKTSQRALLVMHSPTDNTVSIDHATQIFVSAKHPKSFVSLDNADHLLSSVADAEYAATVIGAWADKFLPQGEDERPALEEGEVFVRTRPESLYTHDVFSKKHHIVMDEPKRVKGQDLGMNPYDILLASLGGCSAMTMKMYAERKGFDLQQVEVRLRHEKIYAKDCEACETESGLVDQITKSLKVSGNLSDEERQKVYEIAERCPVHRTLNQEVNIVTQRES